MTLRLAAPWEPSLYDPLRRTSLLAQKPTAIAAQLLFPEDLHDFVAHVSFLMEDIGDTCS
jgi:hypothetical protein